MEKISSGIQDLDNLIDFLHIGDNVVWEIDAGTSYDVFIKSFIKKSFLENQKVIYISFNRSPQSILNKIEKDCLEDEGARISSCFTLIDCFTSGKGKNDSTFLRFYDKPHNVNVIKINNPKSIPEFTEKLNSIEDNLPTGARYVFDSLTGMQDLWEDENSTYKFFTYMCPRLYDLGTVAYWVLEKEAHSQTFKANLRHITQVVLDLVKKRDKLFFKALRLDGRVKRDAFRPHSYEIEDNAILIVPVKKEPSYDIGSKIKDARIKLGMSQKDLADKIGMTSSFISQIENNQISPSLNSFLQIAETLNINPTTLLQRNKTLEKLKWLIRGKSAKTNVSEKHNEYSIFSIITGDKTSAYIVAINPGTQVNKHFLNYKKEEFIYVLNGDVSVRVDGIEKNIKTGDVVFLKESIPSYWKNKGEKEAELLVVCT
jgi:transcriptional regulator with XRE-family HTH domain